MMYLYEKRSAGGKHAPFDRSKLIYRNFILSHKYDHLTSPQIIIIKRKHVKYSNSEYKNHTTLKEKKSSRNRQHKINWQQQQQQQ